MIFLEVYNWYFLCILFPKSGYIITPFPASFDLTKTMHFMKMQSNWYFQHFTEEKVSRNFAFKLVQNTANLRIAASDFQSCKGYAR